MREYKKEKCEVCNHINETSITFCDECKKKIDYDDWNSYKNKDYHKIVFTDHFEYENDESDIKEFCTWTCLFKYLMNMKEEYDEIKLPEIYKEHLKEFMSFIKTLNII